MSKQRPSDPISPALGSQLLTAAAKARPAYWRKRIFKNTFTRGGRLICVNCWCVKIQHRGRRRTFSLKSTGRAAAAREAHRLFQSIVSRGWDIVGENKGKLDCPTSPPATSGSEPDNRNPRLVHREYSESALPFRGRELSARIEHAGTSHYFPLGTDDEAEAGRKAVEIGRMLAARGWEIVNQKYRRELTAAFRWADNPLAWTYATFHTRPTRSQSPMRRQPVPGKKCRNVIIVEGDAGVRQALVNCVNGHDTFHCATSFARTEEALREIPRRRAHLVLVNHSLGDQSGAALLDSLRELAPNITGLIYAVYEDSDQLFKATPGGAAGYLLKRTPPHRILDPILGAGEEGGLFRENIASCVRQYFQGLFTSWPDGGPAQEMAKLTPREHDILALLSKGYVDKEIAESLRLSIWTVHGHVKNIFEKLDVHTRTEAVVKYLQK